MIHTLKIYCFPSLWSFAVKFDPLRGYRRPDQLYESLGSLAAVPASVIKASILLGSNSTFNQNQLSFISPRLTITSIFIDQSLEYFLSISLISSEIDFLLSSFLCSIDFSSNGILFSLFYTFYVPFFNHIAAHEPLWALFMIFIFSSRSPFFVLLFQYFYLLYPCFFFKGPIHLIEVYTGLNPCPLYHIYYYSCLSIVSLILVLLCLVLFNDRCMPNPTSSIIFI